MQFYQFHSPLSDVYVFIVFPEIKLIVVLSFVLFLSGWFGIFMFRLHGKGRRSPLPTITTNKIPQLTIDKS